MQSNSSVEICVGIDPGIQGAIAFVDWRGALLKTLPMPIIKVDKRSEVDPVAFEFILERNIRNKSAIVVVEKVTAFGMGLTSAFTWGKQLGAIHAIARLLCKDVHRVRPQEWQAVMFSDPKDRSLNTKQKANREAEFIFPQLKEILKLKKNQGHADAALIAAFGVVQFITPQTRKKQ